MMRTLNDGYVPVLQRMFSGKNVDLTHFTAEMVDIFDIAHHLSLICRFNDGTRFHYSVAQHSLYVAGRVWCVTRDVQETRSGLLHDAAEAYISDIVRPVKRLPQLRVLCAMEQEIAHVINQVFNIPPSPSLLVQQTDNEMLAIECAQLFTPPFYPTDPDVPRTVSWQEGIEEQRPEQVKAAFLQCFVDPAEFFAQFSLPL